MKMGERNLLLTYFNNFNFKRTLVSKNMAKVLTMNSGYLEQLSLITQPHFKTFLY